VFAPNCKARKRVVPPPQQAVAPPLPPATPDPAPGAAAASKPPRTAATYRLPWADLLEKVFAVGVLACPACGGRLQVIAFIAEALVAKRILAPNTITEFPIPTGNSGPAGIAAGPDGSLWFTEYYGNKIGRIAP
jgi:hypothetical protein